MTTRRKIRVKLIRVNTTATIRKPRDEVFAYLVDTESMQQWQRATVRAWYTPGGLPEVGAHLHVVTTNRNLGRATESDFTVTEYQPGAVMTLEAMYGPYRFRTRYRVEPAAEGTRLRCEFETRAAEWGARLLSPLVSRVMSRRLVRSLRSLKAQLEERG
jgi:hypothetical protein